MAGSCDRGVRSLRPIADMQVRPTVSLMRTSWPHVRYWLALSASLFFAFIIIAAGFAMGGPRGFFGWSLVALLLITPVGLWWTRWGNAAALIQYAYLVLSTAYLAWAIVMGEFSR
jgi:hypothetical protein